MSTIDMTLTEAGELRVARTDPGDELESHITPVSGAVASPTSWSVSDWIRWLGEGKAEALEMPFHQALNESTEPSSYAWANAVLSLVRLLEAVRISGTKVVVRRTNQPGPWTETPQIDLGAASEHLVGWIIERFEQYEVDVEWRSD